MSMLWQEYGPLYPWVRRSGTMTDDTEARMTYIYTLQELADKIDWEGGLGDALFYFGRELPCDDLEVKDLWREAYDTVVELDALIPDPYDVRHADEEGE